MNITDVKVTDTSNKPGAMKALVSVVIDDAIVIHGFKILESETGLRIASPSRKTASGEFKDTAHPINAEARKQLEDAIFAVYNNQQ